MAYLIFLKKGSCCAFQMRTRANVKREFLYEILVNKIEAMMVIFSTTMLIQRMGTIGLHWQRVTDPLWWLLVDTAQKPTRLKHLIFQQTLGLKWQIILITISKLILLFDIKVRRVATPCSHLILAFMDMPL